MSFYPPFLIGNMPYDLSHLDPVTFETPSAKIGRTIVTWCWFTTHTFTEGAPGGHEGPILLDEGRRPRVFCAERYTLSQYLSAAVQLLKDPDRYVSEGVHERNWLHRTDMTLPAPANGNVTYQVFFALKKAPPISGA